jgi:hypothetical protein
MNVVPELLSSQQAKVEKFNSDDVILDICFTAEFFGISPVDILEYEIPQFLIMRNYALKVRLEEHKALSKAKSRGRN